MANQYDGVSGPGVQNYGYLSQNDPNNIKTQLARAMLASGTDTSPIRSKWQGMARLSQALMGGLLANQARSEYNAQAPIGPPIQNMSGGQPPTSPSMSTAPAGGVPAGTYPPSPMGNPGSTPVMSAPTPQAAFNGGLDAASAAPRSSGLMPGLAMGPGGIGSDFAARPPPTPYTGSDNPNAVASNAFLHNSVAGPGAPSSIADPSMGSPFLRSLQTFESGGRNIPNTHEGTSSGQAQGYNQITTGTWNEFGGQQYAPTALQASAEQQNAVAMNIPMGRWDPKTLNYLRQQGFQINPRATLADNIAMNGGSRPGANMVAGPGAPSNSPGPSPWDPQGTAAGIVNKNPNLMPGGTLPGQGGGETNPANMPTSMDQVVSMLNPAAQGQLNPSGFQPPPSQAGAQTGSQGSSASAASSANGFSNPFQALVDQIKSAGSSVGGALGFGGQGSPQQQSPVMQAPQAETPANGNDALVGQYNTLSQWLMANPNVNPQTRELVAHRLDLIQQVLMKAQTWIDTPGGGKAAIDGFGHLVPGQAMAAAPEFGPISKNPDGSESMGFINKPNQTVAPYNQYGDVPAPSMTGGPSSAPTPASSASRVWQQGMPLDPETDSKLQTLVPQFVGSDPRRQAIVYQYAKELMSGNRQFIATGGAVAKDPDVKAAEAIAGRLDPDGTPQTRFDTIKANADTANPTSLGGQRMAAATSVQHLGSLAEVSDLLGLQQGGKVGNSEIASQVQAWAAKNGIGNGGGGGPLIQAKDAYSIALTPVLGEIDKLYKGGQATEGEVNEMRSDLDPNASPAARRAAITELMGLMQAKVGVLQSQWHMGVGTHFPDLPIVDENGQKGLDYIKNWGATPAVPGPDTTGKPFTPQPGMVHKGYRYNGGDPSKQENWTPVQ